ncbi:DUF2171 domain-containing protein [Allosphingosinicella vermicomposti]|uniref:DUF2171 domain-containing protein n=1 Tax=Allosphingosinicella vermicomposti TaxID=614671 RepID=UPI001FE0C38C|nr:DUF2171 domain-containing protein [Allosphingosinicella vermicomposti]
MANYRSDNRSGGRWQGRDQERGSYGRDYDRRYGREDDDRGFFDRAGDEVRSWFGDEDAERRRERDRMRWEAEGRDRGWTTGSSNDRGDWSRGGYEGRGWSGERAGGGWGNEVSSGLGYRSSGGGSSNYEDGPGGYGRSSGSSAQDTWGGSGFGGSEFGGRRFDRADVGSTGTHGAHPMTAPYGAGGGLYGNTGSGYRSSARSAAIYGASSSSGGDHHDRSYSEWRSRQMGELDRDYDEYRREHQSQFEQEFGNWRSKRQGQRSSLGKVTEHMEVLGSDGEHVGTVDKVRGDRIILTKSDASAGGHHHSIPCSWIETVEDKVTINKSASDAMKAWQDEERSRALFEREDSGSDGPRALNRSFSGTY